MLADRREFAQAPVLGGAPPAVPVIRRAVSPALGNWRPNPKRIARERLGGCGVVPIHVRARDRDLGSSAGQYRLNMETIESEGCAALRNTRGTGGRYQQHSVHRQLSHQAAVGCVEPEQAGQRVAQQPAESIWITSITVFEVRTGLELLVPGRRRQQLEDGFAQLLADELQGRVQPFDQPAAFTAGRIAAERQHARCRSVAAFG